jgi:hypothetical protein
MSVRPGTSDSSLTSLFVLTLFCWVWPLFHSVLIALIETAGYALKLGGGLLHLLACGLSIACAIPFTIGLVRALRRGHALPDPNRIVVLLLICIIAASVLMTGCFMAMHMFCEVGSCPQPN